MLQDNVEYHYHYHYLLQGNVQQNVQCSKKCSIKCSMSKVMFNSPVRRYCCTSDPVRLVGPFRSPQIIILHNVTTTTTDQEQHLSLIAWSVSVEVSQTNSACHEGGDDEEKHSGKKRTKDERKQKNVMVLVQLKPKEMKMWSMGKTW